MTMTHDHQGNPANPRPYPPAPRYMRDMNPPEAGFVVIEGPAPKVVDEVREKQRMGWEVISHSTHPTVNGLVAGVDHVVAMVLRNAALYQMGLAQPHIPPEQQQLRQVPQAEVDEAAGLSPEELGKYVDPPPPEPDAA